MKEDPDGQVYIRHNTENPQHKEQIKTTDSSTTYIIQHNQLVENAVKLFSNIAAIQQQQQQQQFNTTGGNCSDRSLTTTQLHIVKQQHQMDTALTTS